VLVSYTYQAFISDGRGSESVKTYNHVQYYQLS
jgi:hypothetical protein